MNTFQRFIETLRLIFKGTNAVLTDLSGNYRPRKPRAEEERSEMLDVDAEEMERIRNFDFERYSSNTVVNTGDPADRIEAWKDEVEADAEESSAETELDSLEYEADDSIFDKDSLQDEGNEEQLD